MNSKRIAFGLGIALAVLAVLAAPAMAGDPTFYFVPDTVIIEPGEEVTVLGYLNVDEPVGTFQSAVVYDQDVVECLGVVEVEGVTNWYLWLDEGTGYPTASGKEYFWYKGVEFLGHGPGNLLLGNITLRGVSPGISTLYAEGYPKIPDGNNRSIVTDMSHPCIYLPWVSETLTVICGSPETFTTSLTPGWNLKSPPLIPVNDSTSAVLGNDDCTIVYNKVYSYDASTNLFVDVTDGTMEAGVGYFVNVTTEGTWSYDGFADESLNSELSQGLNCVGWTNTSADIPGGALASIAGDYRYVARWNAAEQKYELYDPVGETEGPEFIDFTTMERGVGYFIAATTGCTLTYP